jgi:hypothetical protein
VAFLIFSLFALLVQLLVPGYILCLLLRRRSVSDIFFFGFLVNASLVIVLSVFFADTDFVAQCTRVAVVFITAGSGLLVFRRKTVETAQTFETIPIRRYLVLIGSIVVILMGVYVATHNLGYDDIAHLQYLLEIPAGDRFPVFRSIVGHWHGARYPYYGLVIGTLGAGLSGGNFISYYVLGGLVFAFFLLKIFEVISTYQRGYRAAVATLFLVSIVLLVGGFDNYFNFGLYPLQQAKIFFMIGLIYIVAHPQKRATQTDYIVGTGLVSLGILYHLNLFLLIPAYLVVLAIVIVVRTHGWKEKLVYSMIPFILPVLVAVATVNPDNRFIRYEEPPVVESSVSGGDVLPKPTFFYRISEKLESLAGWIKKGRYRDAYISRAYSKEILLIPALVFVATSVAGGVLGWLWIPSCLVFGWALGSQSISTLPKQLASAYFKSGPAFVVFDLEQSAIDIDEIDKKGIVTDPYTKIMLRSLGYQQINSTELPITPYLFSPLVRSDGIGYGLKRAGLPEESTIIFNSRLWGPKAAARFEGRNLGMAYPFDAAVEGLIEKQRIQEVAHIAGAFKSLANQFFKLKLVVRQASSVGYPEEMGPPFIKFTEVASVYRDTALVNLGTLEANRIKVVRVYGTGDGIVIDRSILSGEHITIKKFHMADSINPSAPKGIGIIASSRVNIPYLFFTLNTGHLGSLGAIDSVSIQEYPCWVTMDDIKVLLGITDKRREMDYLYRIIEPQRSKSCKSITI